MNIQEITSNVNPKIKEVAALLEKSKERRKSSLFVVEGLREVNACISNNFEIASIFFNNQIISPTDIDNLCLPKDAKVFSTSANAYSKIAYRENTEGIIAVVKEKKLSLDNIKLGKKWDQPLILVVESVEKPGNLGALLRTCDACGVDAVLVCDPLT
ncbi:MAG: RNA methyltransferase, partial [Bacteroidales bacterium]|nr:RNA methyltransferase [Bacteroidales bacterium]